MRKWTKRVLLAAIALAAILYLGACLLLRLNEAKLIFPHTLPYIPPSPYLALNQQRVQFGEADGTAFYAWLIPCLPQDHSDLWLLFFHGNAENVSRDVNSYDDFRSMGFNVMAPEYPGYADSPGSPSEAGIEREAQMAYDYLRNVKQVPAKNIVIFGVSLGAAFAIDLASKVQAGALVEHAGFTSIPAVGRELFPLLPVSLLFKTRLESDTKIGNVKMPVLIVHSSEDSLIPFSQAQQLYQLAPSPKRLVAVHGSHGPEQTFATVSPNFYSDIVAFLNENAGFHLRPPMPSIAPVMAATIDAQGIGAALAQYHLLIAENPRRYNFREAELDSLGYDLFMKKKFDTAVSVLELNAQQFPQSFNAFDSLGDAYAAAGKNAEAIQSYQHSLELFPGSENYSRPKLDQLRKSSKG
jgi:uncharacterized protein